MSAFVVVDFVSLLTSRDFRWKENVWNDLILCRVVRKTFIRSIIDVFNCVPAVHNTPVSNHCLAFSDAIYVTFIPCDEYT